MTRDPLAAFMSDLAREFAQPKVPHSGKWEFWTNSRRRSRTICVRLWPDTGELTISHRCIDSNGCMSELNSFSCDLEHLPKLIHALNRALAVATERGLIKQPKK